MIVKFKINQRSPAHEAEEVAKCLHALGTRKIEFSCSVIGIELDSGITDEVTYNFGGFAGEVAFFHVEVKAGSGNARENSGEAMQVLRQLGKTDYGIVQIIWHGFISSPEAEHCTVRTASC